MFVYVHAGIKVWIRYQPGHVQSMAAAAHHKPALSLSKLLDMAANRPALPVRSAAAWWTVPGPLQPLSSRTWEAFAPDYRAPGAGPGAQPLARSQGTAAAEHVAQDTRTGATPQPLPLLVCVSHDAYLLTDVWRALPPCHAFGSTSTCR